MSQPFLTGVIEGFYGRPWPHEVRLAYAGILATAGLNTCIYAPKSDAVLRREWRGRWGQQDWQRLRELAAAYEGNGLFWGVGLSPMQLYECYDAKQKAYLRDKVAYLQELGISVLAILFDDMPGNLADLAERQAQIMCDVALWAPGTRLLMCPTYYSHDPVLEKYFGDKPEGYWPELGAALPGEVGIFWTGNAVCAESVTAADIGAINAEFGRRVTLWDNYPVNDGAARADFLYLEPLDKRDPALAGLLDGHLCNPMNQGWLSLPALSGLARLYRTGDAGDAGEAGEVSGEVGGEVGGEVSGEVSGIDEPFLARTLGEACWERLKEDAGLFRGVGLEGMGPDRRAELAALYGALPGPAAREVVGWLRGDYAFDPACLTG